MLQFTNFFFHTRQYALEMYLQKGWILKINLIVERLIEGIVGGKMSNSSSVVSVVLELGLFDNIKKC